MEQPSPEIKLWQAVLFQAFIDLCDTSERERKSARWWFCNERKSGLCDVCNILKVDVFKMKKMATYISRHRGDMRLGTLLQKIKDEV